MQPAFSLFLLEYHTLLTKKLWVDKTTNYTSPQLSVTIFYTGIFWLEKSYLVFLCWSVWNETPVKIFANSLCLPMWMQEISGPIIYFFDANRNLLTDIAFRNVNNCTLVYFSTSGRKRNCLHTFLNRNCFR